MNLHRCCISVFHLAISIISLPSFAVASKSLDGDFSNDEGKALLRRRNINNRELAMGKRLATLQTQSQQMPSQQEEQQPILPTPRIIGGSVVNDPSERYPYFALMRGEGLCGAVLVSSKFVLTAAHCAYADDDFEIGGSGGGSTSWWGTRSQGREYGYKTGRIHPGYNEGDVSNDIAIFELESEVPSTIRPMQIRKDPVTASGLEVTVIGYGDTNPSDSITDTSSSLQEVTLRYVPANRCESDFGSNWFSGSYIDDGMMCALSPGKDSCGGDSGGPLMTKGSDASQDELVGLVSWGVGCDNDDYPGVYTRISYYWDWIERTACELNPSAVPTGMSCGDGGAVVPQPTQPVSQPSSPSEGSDNGSGTVIDYGDDDWLTSLLGGGGDTGSAIDDYTVGGYDDTVIDDDFLEATANTIGSWFTGLFDW